MKLSPEEQAAKAKLTSLGLRAERHWKEHRPRMYRGLLKEGKLYQSLLQAQEQTFQLQEKLEDELRAKGYQTGMACLIAESQALREYILLPSEEDLPELARSLEPYR